MQSRNTVQQVAGRGRTVQQVAASLGISVPLALFVFRKIDRGTDNEWSEVSPGKVAQFEDILSGNGALFPTEGDYARDMPRSRGDLRRWVLMELDRRMREEATFVAPQAETTDATRSRVIAFAPAPRETTEREKRGDGDDPFSKKGPPPIAYPAQTKSPGNTRLVVRVSKQRASGLLFTDAEATEMPWDTFDLVIEGGLGWVDRIRCTKREFESVVSTGGAVVPREEIWDEKRKMLENILFGVCLLTLNAHSPGTHGSTNRAASAADRQSAIEALTKPASDIEVDLVNEAEEQLYSANVGLRHKIGKSTLVRGHFANQPCGPGGTERKRIWRRPHYSPKLGLMRSKQVYVMVS